MTAPVDRSRAGTPGSLTVATLVHALEQLRKAYAGLDLDEDLMALDGVIDRLAPLVGTLQARRRADQLPADARPGHPPPGEEAAGD